MIKKYFFIACFILPGVFAWSQNTGQDTLPVPVNDAMVIDTSMDYDDLLSDLDLFLDSILAPRSYFLTSLSMSQGYFNYTTRNSLRTRQVQKLIWSPSLGYYAKSGFGVTLTGYMVYDSTHLNLYQVSISPSFDYLKNRDLAAGISFVKYFTRDSLTFYTSPLQNEISGYFIWRKSWLRPGITASYARGNRTEYTKREIIYKKLVATATANGTIRDIDTISIFTANKESIVDFSMAASLRHDFYFLNIFSNKDHIRFTPLLSLSAGTQKFGFNQTTSAFGNARANVLNNTRSLSLQQKFRVLSMTLYLRSEYSLGKFFFQPQVLFDYYFPAENKKFSTLFSLNTGFLF
jgi:hypothetical protein